MPREAKTLEGSRLGAVPRGDGTVDLTVWAPLVETLEVHAAAGVHRLEREDGGVHAGRFPCAPGDHYLLALDGTEAYPDPCSAFQPHGVRGPSEVVDHASFTWSDAAWPGLQLDELALYELHVGTFTEEGTFDAVVPRLSGLRELGVTAIELMPVCTFPGERGWGY